MDNQLSFAEIITNIWWVYNPSIITFNQSHKDLISQICTYHNIQEIIKIDTLIPFWKKTSQYVPVIQQQINNNDHLQLYDVLNNICNKLTYNYLNGIPTLIISIYNNDVGIANIIFFYAKNMNSDIKNIDIIYESLSYKIINIPKLTTRIRQFFISISHNFG